MSNKSLGERYDRATFDWLIWLFRIDTKKNIEEQPRSLVVIAIHWVLTFPPFVAFFTFLAGLLAGFNLA